MTSERTDRANRQNAQASTGPRTRAGKARSSQNARKHGLSAAGDTLWDPEELDRLVEVLLGGALPNPELRDAARAVAEAHIHLKRVLACKRAVAQSGVSGSTAGRVDGATRPVDVTPELLRALVGLERYERRAFSRRRSATRHFMALADRHDTAVHMRGLI